MGNQRKSKLDSVDYWMLSRAAKFHRARIFEGVTAAQIISFNLARFAYRCWSIFRTIGGAR